MSRARSCTRLRLLLQGSVAVPANLRSAVSASSGPATPAASETPVAAVPPSPLQPSATPGAISVIALADCDASAPSLQFKAGDVLSVTTKREDGWWLGELNGQQGWVFNTFVKPA